MRSGATHVNRAASAGFGESAARVYTNAGNPALLQLVAASARRVLDVGCGAGDNAALLRARTPAVEIYGITASSAEAALAARHMTQCWVADLEQGLPAAAQALCYDAVVFSHVLEHLRDPAELVRQAAACLRPGGTCAIAVPNVMMWRERAKFLVGRFEYQASGTLDSTHLRFFTYETAVPFLLARAPNLRVTQRHVTGSAPLWLLRRHLLPQRAAQHVDELACRWLPNLFGSQVLIAAVKQDA
jgi:SAM-dependent methyltransferase